MGKVLRYRKRVKLVRAQPVYLRYCWPAEMPMPADGLVMDGRSFAVADYPLIAKALRLLHQSGQEEDCAVDEATMRTPVVEPTRDPAGRIIGIPMMRGNPDFPWHEEEAHA